jgi:hypothetical protein
MSRPCATRAASPWRAVCAGWALVGAAALAVTPVAAAAKLADRSAPMCGGHAPLRMPAGRTGDMPTACHAACAGIVEKKRLASA